MKRALAVILTLAALSCGGGSGGSAGAGSMIGNGLVVSFTPDQPIPGPGSSAMAPGPSSGDTITVQVELTGINNLRSAGFDVLFDDAALDFIGFVRGDAIEQGGGTALYVASANTTGVLTVGVDLAGPGSVSIAGTRTLIGLIFRARRTGSYALKFQSESLRNQNLQPIAATWYAGTLGAV